ncbi:MAG: electron transfer flavoprotein subunit beta/FixA family protein [Promethearchaeota archaeon]
MNSTNSKEAVATKNNNKNKNGNNDNNDFNNANNIDKNNNDNDKNNNDNDKNNNDNDKNNNDNDKNNNNNDKNNNNNDKNNNNNDNDKELNIIVCIKQVPATEKIKFNWKTGSLVRENIESIMNPDDRHAIEMALEIKEKFEGKTKITAITLGPPQAKEVLWEAYVMGADHCILITDERFKGSDTLVTSKILMRAIKKIGNFDIIITGFETIDGNTAQVHYQLAELLDIPHLTQIDDIEIEGNSTTISRLYGHEYQKVKTNLPILIATKRESNLVRYLKFIDIKKCFEKKIQIWTMEDIGGSEEDYGFKGSPTITLQGDIITHVRKRQEFKGTLDEKVNMFIQKLKKYGFLKT